MNTLKEVSEHSRKWLFQAAAPLWGTQGVLDDGMFAERLTLQGQPVKDLPRRLRVQARQIYSFCAIGDMGWEGNWRGPVSRALDKVLAHGFRSDGFCIHTFSPDGAAADLSLDLYNHAFLMFALGTAGAKLGRTDAIERAAEIRDLLLAKWSRPEGGFWEGELTPCPPHRQNPHMHLFEAAIANFNATGDEVWKQFRDQISDLFVKKFQDEASGAITEYYTSDWGRVPGPKGEIVEPGHCLEWAWLLETAYPDGRYIEYADRLSAFARAHGISAGGVALDEIDVHGRIVTPTARLWPQTERLKAAICRYRRIRDKTTEYEVVSAYKGLSLYFETPTPGVWRDRLNADGGWIEEDAPASSFYHIVCALVELNSPLTKTPNTPMDN